MRVQMQNVGQVSDDGRWRWDGAQWVPNTALAPSTGGYVVAPPAGTIAVAPKSPGIGLLVSFFLPGVGSMINGNGGIGALILILYLVGWALSFFLIGIPLAIGAWIWGLIDGYTSAQRWNRAHGILS
jgi:TM2 domain-containing membrane protein YozV